MSDGEFENVYYIYGAHIIRNGLCAGSKGFPHDFWTVDDLPCRLVE